MSDPKKLISELEEVLSNNPLVIGFILVGSQAREEVYKASRYSDLEAYIIVQDYDLEKMERELPKIVNKLGIVIFSYKNRWAGFSTLFEDLFRLELPIAKKSEVSSIFSRPIAQAVKVLIDKTEGELKKALNNRPKTLDYEKLFHQQVTDFWYMLVTAVQYYKKGEIFNARHALGIIQSSFIKMAELYNDPKILLLETNKRVEQFLGEKQLLLLRKISPGYNKEDVIKSLKSVLKVYPKVIKQVAEKYKYQYDNQIQKQILRNKLLENLEQISIRSR